ncbi:MAG: hypothetical protein MUF87_10850 [Anaerolineae bacterium]|jgi:hypothetical protein|nr:hypothetical protein [Anaerolineae bacterium]
MLFRGLFVLILFCSVTFAFAKPESACERQVLLTEGFLSQSPIINTDQGWVILTEGEDLHAHTIFKFTLETGELTALTPAEVSAFEPLYLDSEQEIIVYFQTDQLKAVDLHGNGTVRQLTDEAEGVNTQTLPVVGSDHVIYLSHDRLMLKSVRLDGTASPVTLYQGETITAGMQTVDETVQAIAISPDGQSVLFSADQFDAKSETLLYRVPIEGGDPVQISMESITEFLITDQAVIYRTEESGALIRHALDTDQATILTPPDQRVGWFRWVNDRLFYAKIQSQVVNEQLIISEGLFMPSEGQLSEIVAVDDVLYSPKIVMIGQQIYFAKTANARPYDYALYRHDLQNGTIEALIDQGLWMFEAAGDSLLAMTQVRDGIGDLYLIDGNTTTHLNAEHPGRVALPRSSGLDRLFFNASLIAYNFVDENETRIGVVYRLATESSEVFEAARWIGLDGTSLIYNDLEARSVVWLLCD